MSAIVWAGVPSDHVGVVVERFPGQPGPARRYESISVPGRNGDLLVDTGAYDNYAQDYAVYFNAERRRTPAAARAVRAWLQGPVGYQRLEDSYDPQFFRTAYYAGPAQIENVMNRFGRMTVSFVCKPQRWRRDGERPILLAAPGALTNDLFPALPLIRVLGDGPGVLSVGGYTVDIKVLDGELMLDCDLQDAYQGTQNKNAAISTAAFPVLERGESWIGWTGGISRVEITPRWWTI